MKKKLLFILIVILILIISFGIYFNHTSAPALYKNASWVPFSNTLISEKGIANIVILDNVKKGDIISSPFTLKGKAKNWYFEGSFPIEVRNSNDSAIFRGLAEAQGNWISGDYVPFETKIIFSAQPAGSIGTLILKRDNPSGLAENDDSIRVPIIFK